MHENPTLIAVLDFHYSSDCVKVDKHLQPQWLQLNCESTSN